MKTILTSLALVVSTNAYATTFHDSSTHWEIGEHGDSQYAMPIDSGVTLFTNECDGINLCNDITIKYVNGNDYFKEENYYSKTGSFSGLIAQDFKVEIQSVQWNEDQWSQEVFLSDDFEYLWFEHIYLDADQFKVTTTSDTIVDDSVSNHYWDVELNQTHRVNEFHNIELKHYVEFKPKEITPVPVPLPILMLGSSVLALVAYKRK